MLLQVPSTRFSTCRRGGWRLLRPTARPQQQQGAPALARAQQHGAQQPGGGIHQIAIDALLQLSQREREEVTLSTLQAFLDGPFTTQPAAAAPRGGGAGAAVTQQVPVGGTKRRWADGETGSSSSRRRRQQARGGKASGGSSTSSSSNGGDEGSTGKATAGQPRRQQAKQQEQGEAQAQQAPTAIDEVVGHLCSGRFDEALLEGMPTAKLNWAIKVLGARQRVDLAEQLFHWMRLKHMANEHSFVKLCEACEATCQPTRALRAWRNTRRMQAAFTLAEPAAAALLKTFRAKGDLKGGLAVLAELERSGAALNQYAYNVVLRMCADKGNLGTALRLLRRMREGGGAGLPQGQQLSPQRGEEGGGPGNNGRTGEAGAEPAGGGPVPRDERTYGAVLGAVRAACAWARTPMVHRWMQQDGVCMGPVLGAQLLSCYAAAGGGPQAEGVMEEMQKAGVRPNRTHFNSLIYAHAEARDWAACKAAYQRMLAAGQRPDAYTLVALLRGLMYAAALEARLRAERGEAGRLEARAAGSKTQPPAPAEQQQQQHPELEGWPDSEVASLQRQMREHRVALTPRVGTAFLAYWLGVARDWQPPEGQEPERPQQPAPPDEGGATEQPAGPEQQHGQQHQQQQQQQPRQPHQQRALAQARAVWGVLRRPAAGTQGPGGPKSGGGGDKVAAVASLDLRAFNCWMEVQLAAGDYRGVLRTFAELERSKGLIPDGETYRVAIAAAARAGQTQKERELLALRDSWRLLHGREG